MSTRLGHCVGSPAETALKRVELWKNVGRNVSIDHVLENFKSAGCERNMTVGIKRGGVTIALHHPNKKSGLPSGWKNSEAQDQVEEGKQKMTSPCE